jgi:phosphatidylserine/phosphatidylglycerophosphate/cardiolipin synthase-like enzyme
MVGVNEQKRSCALFIFSFISFFLNAQSNLKIAKTNIFDINAAGFSEKFNLVSKATQNIDMVYFIIEDDYSTSLFFKKVLEKMKIAKEKGSPIRTRVLVDYFMSEKQLPFLRLLENSGIEIKRYAGPNPEWIENMKELNIDSQTFLSGLMSQDAKIIKDSLPKELKENFGNDTFADLTPQEKLSLILATLQRIGPSGPRVYAGLTSFLFRTHHKLLIIDGKCFMTGGRNLSDEYHASKGDILIDGNEELGIEPRHYPFQDIDVSSCLENQMDYSNTPLTESFEHLWKHPLNVDLHTNFTAPELETSNVTKIEELHRKAKLAEHLLKSTQSSLTLEQAGGLNAQYVENVMTPSSIVNSGITDLYTNLFKSLNEGDEASFVNAYFYLDPKLFTGHQEKDSKMNMLYTSMIEAAQRKAKLSIHTNSITTTDLSIVNVLSYPFYRKFLSENIQIKELYKASDLDQGSLHKKTAYFSRPKKGDVLIVGSYNLDARSHYKDTNVALSIEIPNNLREEAFKAFNRYTSGSLKWSEVNETRLHEIEETVVKEKNKIKLRRFLYPFRNEI